MGGLCARLKVDAARFGWSCAVRIRVVDRALRALRVELYSVRATPIELDRPPPKMPDSFEVRRLTRDDLVAAGPAMDMSEAFIDEALARGDVAYGAFDGEKLASYVWRTLTEAPHVERVRVRVNRPYSYIYKSFTLPEYRGNRLVPNIILRSDPYFVELGYSYRNAFIHVCNEASLRSALRIGSRFLGYAGYAEWLGRRHYFHTPAVRRIGFQFFDAPHPG